MCTAGVLEFGNSTDTLYLLDGIVNLIFLLCLLGKSECYSQ